MQYKLDGIENHTQITPEWKYWGMSIPYVYFHGSMSRRLPYQTNWFQTVRKSKRFDTYDQSSQKHLSRMNSNIIGVSLRNTQRTDSLHSSRSHKHQQQISSVLPSDVWLFSITVFVVFTFTSACINSTKLPTVGFTITFRKTLWSQVSSKCYRVLCAFVFV